MIQIDQVLPSFGKYDAIGTDTMLIKSLLEKRGFASEIYAYDQGYGDIAKPFASYVQIKKKSSILIHHFSIGSSLPYALDKLRVYNVTRFHNITPHVYFPLPGMVYTKSQCLKGEMQIPLVKKNTHRSWAASEFNAKEMVHHGFENPQVLPVLRAYDKLANLVPQQEMVNWFKKQGKKTLLFVGRMLPHKAHHDLMFLLKQLKVHVRADVQLVFVGSADPFYKSDILLPLAKDLGLQWRDWSMGSKGESGDVWHFGSVTDHELASIYHASDAFVCLSDHEGFCVPLVEAMTFGLPVIAYDTTAIGQTCGNGAQLFNDKSDKAPLVQYLKDLFDSRDLYQEASRKSSHRAKDFSWERLELIFNGLLDDVCKDFAFWSKESI